ncbi:MAG: hypothetical protein J6T10_32410 [Methanobrevibacter sp.]|nr:hypothetical protein [Methanobrevibacter sp.]
MEEEEMRNRLLEDGINFALVSKMTREQLVEATSIQDYDDYNNYLLALAILYDI